MLFIAGNNEHHMVDFYQLDFTTYLPARKLHIFCFIIFGYFNSDDDDDGEKEESEDIYDQGTKSRTYIFLFKQVVFINLLLHDQCYP